MDDTQLFLTAARQAGYGPEASASALAWAIERIAAGGRPPARLYIFRSVGVGGHGAVSGPSPTRPRVLLAFRSADEALSFAQRHGLGGAPRLASMGPGQLLTALIQRPTIGALLVAADEADTLQEGLPPGARVERATLLDQLQIADCRL